MIIGILTKENRSINARDNKRRRSRANEHLRADVTRVGRESRFSAAQSAPRRGASLCGQYTRASAFFRRRRAAETPRSISTRGRTAEAFPARRGSFLSRAYEFALARQFARNCEPIGIARVSASRKTLVSRRRMKGKSLRGARIGAERARGCAH